MSFQFLIVNIKSKFQFISTVSGTTGEGPSLSTDERKKLAESWKQAINHTKQHLMVQVGGAPLPDVLELVIKNSHN